MMNTKEYQQSLLQLNEFVYQMNKEIFNFQIDKMNIVIAKVASLLEEVTVSYPKKQKELEFVLVKYVERRAEIEKNLKRLEKEVEEIL
jgi:hypothetical protein